MFKNYLRVYPAPLQFFIFISFWSALMLVFLFVQPLYIQHASGISSTDISEFSKKEIFNHPDILVIANLLYQIICILLPALLFAYLAHPQMFKYLGLNTEHKSKGLLWIIILSICIIPIIGILANWIKSIDLGTTAGDLSKQREEIFGTYLKNTTPAGLIRNILVLALIPAICEEIFFRGILLRFVNSWIKRPLLSVFITSLLFALPHASIYDFLPITLAGFVLGWLYFTTGNLWLSILAHFIHNGLQVIIIYFSQIEDMSIIDQNPVYSILSFCIFTVIGIYSIRKIKNNHTALPKNWGVVHQE